MTLQNVWVLLLLCAVTLRAGTLKENIEQNPKDLDLKDYTKMRFDTKSFQTGNSTNFNSEFKTKSFSDFGLGENKSFNGTYATKNFQGTNSYQMNSKSLFSENQRFDPGGKEIKGQAFPVGTARESGQMSSQFALQSSQEANKMYQGPEMKVTRREVKVINDSLKNKDDLEAHRLSEEEIKKILNKNK